MNESNYKLNKISSNYKLFSINIKSVIKISICLYVKKNKKKICLYVKE